MELFQVRYVLAAARSLNFTKAAAESNVSQPALTKAIKGLEEEFGAPLFHREGKRMLLSEFGQSLLPHFQQMAQEADATRLLADNFRLLRQTPIRVGVMVTIGPVRLSRFLARFQRDFQGVEIAVSESSLAEVDLAVLNAMGEMRDSFTVHDLYDERYLVVFPPDHRLERFNAVPLKELSGEPYVDRLACEFRETVMALCKETGVQLYARFRSEREDWIQAMVMARIGFAFMPESAVTAPEILRRPLVEPEVKRTISLVSMPGRKYSPAVAAFVRAAQGFDWIP
jgi:DNA-binding transcriptional LysR family regulator